MELKDHGLESLIKGETPKYMFVLSLEKQAKNVMEYSSYEGNYVDWLKWVSLEDEFDPTTLCSSNMSTLF